MKKKLVLLTFMAFASLYVHANPLGYDVVYVRYPNHTIEDRFVGLPQGESAYSITAGADLMLLKADSSEVVLVDCTDCSVMDPIISFDGNTVYYSLIVDIWTGTQGNNTPKPRATAGWIYKIHLDDPNYTPIRLTFDDGFDSMLYAGNNNPEDGQGEKRFIRDMTPIPLADGRLLLTSNRSATTALDPFTEAIVSSSVQHLYTMDDHEGELNTSELSNLRQLETGSLHMIQHPIQLKDGRILFTTWQDVGHKFHYAMSPLFTINPDGTNMQQFTEPHDKNKYLDHFITQLVDESVVAGYYYPSFDYGYGILHRMPVEAAYGRNWLKGSVVGSNRKFDRKGTVNMTPHSTPGDIPAPNRSGKYSMPSVGAKGSMLVAYSKGYVNHFSAVCRNNSASPSQDMNTHPIDDNGFKCEELRSGIYMIPNATTNIIYDPDTELVMVKDSPDYNEIWPRAVLSYQELMGVEKPTIIPTDRSHTNNATAYTGTSSMYNRESMPIARFGELDPFNSGSIKRELHDGNWKIQGTDAGVYTNADIKYVRILGTPALPYNNPIEKFNGDTGSADRAAHAEVTEYALASNLDSIVAKYGSFHGERWEILGEFPLSHTDTIDDQGNPDTSWIAKIGADTPHMIQTLDINGMTLNSEMTWRGLKAGEARTDCGGCHIHSGPELDIATTQAGKGVAITGVAGLLDSDFRIANGIWNLTTGSIPVLTENGTEFIAQGTLGAEWKRDVYPVMQSSCISCHGDGGQTPDFTGTPKEVYLRITKESGYMSPQRSKYIRSPQARQSLLAWIVYEERLDGRLNSTRDDDVDYPDSHPALNLPDADKRKIARWIDMGGPVDFPVTNGFGYTEDSQLPIVTQVFIKNKPEQYANHFSVGMYDQMSGLDWTTLAVSYYTVANTATVVPITIDQASKVDDNDVLHVDVDSLIFANGTEYVLKVTIEDLVGNKNVYTERLTKGAVIL